MSDRSEIHPLIWQGRQPETVEQIGDFALLVLTAEDHREKWPQFGESRVCNVAEALLFDDQQTMPEVNLSPAHQAASLVAVFARKGRKSLVTCAMGMNRSGLVVALALRDLLGLTGSEAMAMVREKRPGSLFNPAFSEYLESLP
jgi:hypothetical protein